MIVPTAPDLLDGKRDPLDWYIEICAVCGCQLGRRGLSNEDREVRRGGAPVNRGRCPPRRRSPGR